MPPSKVTLQISRLAFGLFALTLATRLGAQVPVIGLERSAGGLTLRVDALRDDVLRVRLFPTGHAPEDASWAVLPAARTARVRTTPTDSGFRTSALVVSVGADLQLTVTDPVGHVLQADAAPTEMHTDAAGTSFRIHKVMDGSDHFFGLGDKPGPLDRRSESFVMWGTDSFGWQESTDPIYKDIPFFIDVRDGGRAVGVFLDNTTRTFFDFGHEDVSQYTMSAPSGPVDYYLLAGPTPKQVVEAYGWLTGPTPLPPLWSLGYQQSRYSYFPQSEVEQIAHRLRADRIPADAIYLDIDYQDQNRPFTVDPKGFPDFRGLIADLTRQQLHTVLITDLHIAALPNAGYTPYDSGAAGDHFVKERGQTYIGKVWPGPSVFPEFTQASSRAWWGSLYAPFVADGASGFWNDMNEPAVFSYPTKTMPDDVQHRIGGDEAEGFAPRTALHPEIHNVYGMLNSRATFEGLRNLQPNTRPFVLTRASYAGGQRYAATWTGDNLATWNHLRQTTPQILNLGLSGFAMSGADVGGFGGSPSPELLTRWLILGAFQPIDRDHAAKGTRSHEPWVDGPEQEAIRRRYIEERYRLMPYLYTTAEEMSRTGLPITRPLFLEFPNATTDGHPLDLDGAGGEYFFGPDLLVAASPLPDDIAPYEAKLPPAIWYDWWTGAKLDRRELLKSQDKEIRDASTANSLPPVMLSPSLDQLPIFARAGSIVPMAPLTQSTTELPNGPLTLRIFPPAAPGDDCQGDVYIDDGASYGFQRGDFARQHITCALAPDGAITVSLAEREGRFKPWWNEVRLELVAPASNAAVTAQANPINPDGSYSTAPLVRLTAEQHVPQSADVKGRQLTLDHTALGVAVTVPNRGQAISVNFH